MIGDAERARLVELAQAESIPSGGTEPGVTEWLSDVAQRALGELFEGSFPAIGAAAPWLAGIVLLLAAIVGALVVTRVVSTWRRVRKPDADPVPSPIVRSRPATREEVAARLGAQDAAGALRTLWRWVGESLEARGYARFVPDRTNQELLADVRRAAPGWERLPSFTRLTHAVDGLLFAGLPLDTDAVARLLPLADEVVAP